MSGIRDTATVTLNINGAQAKQMMSDLEQKVSDTKKKISDLKAAMADPKDIEKARKELKSYEKQLDEVRSATQGVESALGNIDSATPRQLEKALRTLNRQLKDMPPGSETWDSHIEKIKELKARLAEIKDETNEQESLWSKFKDWAMGAWPAIDLLGQWGSGFMDAARKAVEAFSDMDQEMANVRKFTGMTSGEVDKLNESLKGIDTRTSREDLNKLAQEAGRLGKTSQADVLGFVRAADKINVALDDLGEGATLTLSKLTGIFGDEQRYGTEQSLLKVGSVINELSQNCAASAPYLAEFASRMGGVGAQAGMTIQQIMGFAAVLDSNEQKVEASSTALSQVIVRMMQDPAKYAKVAGLDVKKFTTMLKEDANGALLLFLETLQKAGGMDVLSPMFKDMGENGSRAIAALSTLATHIDEVKAQQEAANVAFKEGTSIDNEFSVQNNTVQASLDKAKKAVNEIRVELGQRLQPVMAHVISSSSALLRAMAALVTFVFDNKASVIALTATIAAYTVAINLAAVRTKLHAMYMSAHAVATKAWSAAVSLSSKVIAPFRIVIAAATNSVAYFTNGLRVNYEMQQRWSNALTSFKGGGWIGFVVAATAALGLLAKKFVDNYNAAIEARRKQEALAKSLVDVSSKSKEYAEKEIFILKKLYEQATDTAEGEDKRTSAAQRLIKMYPDILSGFSKEEIAAGKAKDAYDRLTESIMKNAEARAAADLLYENKKKMLQLQVERKQFSDQRKDASARRDEIRERNRRINARASESAESLTGALAMQAGGSQSLYQQESTIAVDKEVVEATKKMNEKTREINTYAAAVDYIWNQYKDNSKFVDHLVSVESEGSEAPLASYGGKGYTSQVQAEKDAKKAQAEKDAEETWKDREEALAKISYQKGESDYEQYTLRMSQIQEDYYTKLLDRDDVAGDERLQILAKYWEAVNKRTQAAGEMWVGWENDAYEEQVTALKKQYTEKLEAGNLSAEEMESVEKAHQEALELAELEHLSVLTQLTKEGTEARAKAEQQYLEARLKAAKRHQQEYEQAQAEHEKKLASMKDKYFGPNATEKKESYDKDLAILNEVYQAELLAAQDNADEKLRIEKAYQEAKLALQKQYDQESGEGSKNAMKDAVESSLEWLNGDGGKALTGTLDTLTSGMSSIFSGLSTMMQAELEIQTAAINKRYDAEISRAEGNTYQIKKLEKQRDAEQAKAKKEANRKMFAMQIIQAVAQTATNALNAYGSAAAVPVVGYILAPIAAAMAVAAGAIQIAAIKKQQQASESQGYSKGGFTRPGRVDEPAGVVHAGEWVASQKLLASPVARPMIEALDYAQRTNTIGSLRSEDVSRSIRANDSLARAAENNDGTALMVAAMARNAQVIDALDRRLEHPIGAVVTVTGEHGINAGLDEYQQYISNKNPKSRK